MSVVYLALGSNLGKREENIRKAVEELKILGLEIQKLSSIIETDPTGGPRQGKFLNAVLKATTDIPAPALLKELNSIEKKLGRVRKILNGPRTIDIDILLYDKIQLKTSGLTIPHPRMLERDFVMRPLKEIAPDLVKELTHANH